MTIFDALPSYYEYESSGSDSEFPSHKNKDRVGLEYYT